MKFPRTHLFKRKIVQFCLQFIVKSLFKNNVLTVQVVQRDLPSRKKHIQKNYTGIHSPTTLNNRTRKYQLATARRSKWTSFLSLKHCIYNMHLYTHMYTKY